MIKKIIISSIATILLIGFSTVLSAFAADDAIGLVVSPPINEKTANPGEILTGIIKITNPTPMTLDLAVTVEDFRAQGEEGAQVFIDSEENTTGFSMASWIEVEKSFVLKPDETKEIKYTINVPANAEPGGHYGVVFFTPSLEKSETLNGSGASIVPKIGSLFLITVTGEINYDAMISEFSSSQKLYSASKNIIDLITRFQNLSSVHVKPQGTIIIKNILGSTLANLTVNEKQANALPESVRKFTNSWEKKYGFGPYKADLSLTYSNGKTLTDTLTFWIIPWKETAGGILVLLILIFILRNVQWKKK